MIVDTVKHYPPDTAAAFIWLKNRAGWKDKSEVKGELNITSTFMDSIKPTTKPPGERE